MYRVRRRRGWDFVEWQRISPLRTKEHYSHRRGQLYLRAELHWSISERHPNCSGNDNRYGSATATRGWFLERRRRRRRRIRRVGTRTTSSRKGPRRLLASTVDNARRPNIRCHLRGLSRVVDFADFGYRLIVIRRRANEGIERIVEGYKL